MNVIKVRKTGLSMSHDVTILARAVLGSAVLVQLTNTSTNSCIHTLRCVGMMAADCQTSPFVTVFHQPVLRVLYAVDESYCLDASTQKGTVLAIVECASYGVRPSFGIADYPTDSNGEQVYTFDTTQYTNAIDDAHVQVIHLTLNSNYAYTLPENSIGMGCGRDNNSHVLVNATIRFSFCTQLQDKARPYFLTVPQEWTLQIPINQTTDQYPLFHVSAKVR